MELCAMSYLMLMPLHTIDDREQNLHTHKTNENPTAPVMDNDYIYSTSLERNSCGHNTFCFFPLKIYPEPESLSQRCCLHKGASNWENSALTILSRPQLASSDLRFSRGCID